MSIMNLLTRVWNRATDNDGNYFNEEFQKIYKTIGGVGAIFHNPFIIQNPSADFPFLPMRYNDAIIKSAYDSTDPLRSGWPDLVNVMRAMRVQYPTATEGELLLGVPIGRVQANSGTSLELIYGRNNSIERGNADALHYSLRELNDSSAATGTFGLSKGELRNVDLTQFEFTLDSASSTSTIRLTANRDMGVSRVSQGFTGDDRPLLYYYPRRVAGETDQARHYSLKGRALHEPNISFYFLNGLVRRDHFQSHDHRLIKNDGSGAATRGLRRGNSDSNDGREHYVTEGVASGRSGNNTHSPAYFAHAYMVGGRKIDS